MNLPELMADLRKTCRFPTDEEIALVLREGTHRQIAETLVYTACTHKGLAKAYAKGVRMLSHEERIK